MLSAAHCFDSGEMPTDFQVLVGTHDLQRGGRRIDVNEILSHENYSSGTATNDIALLRLARPAEVPAVGLRDAARISDLATPRTTATAIGWGRLQSRCRVRCSRGRRTVLRAAAYRTEVGGMSCLRRGMIGRQ